jgi:uncharacterized protein (DUF885 family)
MIESTRLKRLLLLGLILLLILAHGCGSSRSASKTKTVAPTATLLAEEPTPLPASSSPAQPTGQRSPFDDFLDEAALAQIRRDPETISKLGLDPFLGMGNDQLTNISHAYQLETYALLQAQLDTLHSYDRAALDPQRQLSYDLFEWDLEDRLRGQEFRFYDYPVSQFLGVHTALLDFMIRYHPIANLQDAQGYVSRLKQFTTKMDQLVEWLELQQAEGITPPCFVVEQVLGQIAPVLNAAPRESALYTVFVDKVSALGDVSKEQKSQLHQDTAQAIEQHVVPAYQKLHDYLKDLAKIAGSDDGFWQHPGGAAAYDYWLQHHTTSDMTADQVHALGLQEVARIQAEIEAILAELEVEGHNLAEKMAVVADLSGLVERQDLVDEYQALLDHAEQNLSDFFATWPQADVVVVSFEDPHHANGYYVDPALDGSRPGTFYANLARDTFRYTMPTLAYHEAIPGHHLQGAIQQQLHDLPVFRQANFYTAYSEGWALYAERLAWEAGFYEDDPYGNLGRLQDELFRAARLVVDTGLHAKGWTREQAITYMMENVGFSEAEVTAEVERYVVWPGQATAYKVGMLKILALRQRARETLGEAFDIKEFHDVVLTNGAMPLEILERVVDDYIEAAR